MKTTHPAREVEVCDFCRREGFLTECDVCGRQYCLTDEGTVAGSYGFTNVCRDCSRQQRVQEICDKYAVHLRPIFQQRDAALKRLRTMKSR